MRIKFSVGAFLCAAVLCLCGFAASFAVAHAAEVRSYVPEPTSASDLHSSKKYRLNTHLGTYNGYDVFGIGSTGRFCMELADMGAAQRIRYAAAVNRMAEAVPGARVFNIVVPTAAEFYAGAGMSTNYKPEIADIYLRLRPDIITVDAESALAGHIDENIFFRTDHHWTQLGAYYVYREFLRLAGDSIDPPDAFRRERIGGMQGSFITYLKGSGGEELMKDSSDLLELYYPSCEYSGTAYFDCGLTRPIGEVRAINPDFRNYDCFLEGDYPIAVFKTNVQGGRRLCIVKESFGNAFAVWALNNYSEVYVVDYRCFNGYYGLPENSGTFSLSEFKRSTGFDDLCIISYPITVNGTEENAALEKMAK